MAFSGIPHDAIVFYEQLEADNTKVFWEANRARFKTQQPDWFACFFAVTISFIFYAL